MTLTCSVNTWRMELRLCLLDDDFPAKEKIAVGPTGFPRIHREYPEEGEKLPPPEQRLTASIICRVSFFSPRTLVRFM